MTKSLVRQEGKNVLMAEETTIYVVDISGSMIDTIGEKDGQNISKSGAVRLAMEAVFDVRLSNDTADKVGIVLFGGYQQPAKVLLDPTVIRQEHLKLLSSIGANDDTPMYAGMEKGARLLAEVDGLARIVLMTDGMPNRGGNKDDIVQLVGKLSGQYGIITDCVGIGSAKHYHYDEEFLKLAAREGKGEFYPIDDIDSLVKRLVQTAIERKMLLGKGVMLLGDASQSF